MIELSKYKITDKDKAIELICDFHGRKIEIFDGEKWFKYAVKRIIPMNYPSKKEGINDVEILFLRKNNAYMSIGLYLKDKSWVKNIRLGGINLKAKEMRVIHPSISHEEDWIMVAKFIEVFKLKIAQGAKNEFIRFRKGN